MFLVALLPGLPALGQTTIFSDDFERGDGPLDGWTVYMGTAVSILDGRLVIGPTAAEYWMWAGDPAAPIPPNAENLSFSFDMEFLSLGSNATIGRHGGFAFCGSAPTHRGDRVTPFNGYYVDWIDRTDPVNPANNDRGPRFTRVTGGVSTALVHNGLGNLVNPPPAEPPLEWRVELDDINIRVYGDDVLYIDYEDSTYRNGYFGFWSWSGDQEIACDNLVVEAEKPVLACFEFTPANPTAGSDVFFDAGCSLAAGTITSYEWSFGDGQTGSGETVEHTFAFGENYTVVLTVRDSVGNTGSISKVVPVTETLLPFEDDFERAPGPVDGWTPYHGEWNITLDGKLNTVTPNTGLQADESWVWAGDPPGMLSGDFVMEFDVEFLVRPAGAVGRHAGMMFFSASPSIRWGNGCGYTVDWIDRTAGEADRGFRLNRWGAGGYTVLVPGALASPADPPLRWRIEVDGPNIRVYGDGVLYIDVADATYRDGHVGFFAYANNQDMLIDNVVIASEIGFDLTACYATDAITVLEGQSVTFDAGCSKAPDGVVITAYEWDFGDGTTANGMVVDHAFSVSDTYNVTLTIRAGASSDQLSREIPVYGRALDFEDDFGRANGPVDGWTEVHGAWSILDGELATGPTTTESWIWAGDLPVITSASATFACDYSFLSAGTDQNGRHGGLQFHCTRPTQRTGGTGFSGYLVDWIDRTLDRGPRLTRVDQGVAAPLADSGLGNLLAEPPADPPLEWRVEVDGDHIRVYGDDELYIDVADSTHRGGFFGFWTHAAGQEVRIDNLSVEGVALTPCFTLDRALPQAGKPVAFDAGCSEVFGGGATIASYAWNFGDGGTATSAAASHTYDFPDSYTVTLTVGDSGGESESLARVISVSDDLIPLADCFGRAAGEVDGWTVQQGTWSITGEGKLSTLTAGADSWLWAGDPPSVMAGDFVLEYDLEFLVNPTDANPADTVGRHGGVMFFSQAPTIRGQTSGYTVDWIDRTVAPYSDRGPRLMRWDQNDGVRLADGGLENLLAAVPEEPPLVWRVEADATSIRVFGDGVLYIEIEDDTYREGYFGLWIYANNQDVLYDNIRMGVTTLPTCDEEPVTRFVRGDPDSSGVINITDGIRILSYLFTGGAALECDDAGDTDDDGALTITDAIKVFGYLFLGQGEPAAPAPSDATYLPADCAADPTPGDALGCSKVADTCK